MPFGKLIPVTVTLFTFTPIPPKVSLSNTFTTAVAPVDDVTSMPSIPSFKAVISSGIFSQDNSVPKSVIGFVKFPEMIWLL